MIRDDQEALRPSPMDLKVIPGSYYLDRIELSGVQFGSQKVKELAGEAATGHISDGEMISHRNTS